MSFTKYVKNNTASNVTYLGVTISAGSYYLIQAVEDAKFSSEPDLLTDIGNGDAVMAYDNTGSNDISDVNEAIDFLKNNISRVVIEDIETTLPVSNTYSSKARLELSKPNQTLPRLSQSPYTAFTYSGSGVLANFIMDFNSENVRIILEIDSEQIFDANIKDLKDIYDDVAVYNTWLVYDKKKKAVTFSPEFPIQYNNTVTIKARANSNNSGRKLERIMVDIVKET